MAAQIEGLQRALTAAQEEKALWGERLAEVRRAAAAAAARAQAAEAEKAMLGERLAEGVDTPFVVARCQGPQTVIL